ncbi:MAG: GDSL-type esterase/lipase family protein [Caulobacterales bacterium]
MKNILAKLFGRQEPGPFEVELEAFKTLDAHAPPQPGIILFLGSSSIRLWQNLSGDMAPTPVLNRGFGGATIADINDNFHRVAAPYRPRAIVFYAGDNDLEMGRPPSRVITDFKRFLKLKARDMGDVAVFFISIKPAPARLHMKPLRDEVNWAVQALARQRGDLRYLDIETPMLGAEKLEDLFLADGIHLSSAGYEVWCGTVRPALNEWMAMSASA